MSYFNKIFTWFMKIESQPRPLKQIWQEEICFIQVCSFVERGIR